MTGGSAGPVADERVALGLLGRLTWHGRPLPGERSHALLAALALDREGGLGDQRLVAEVWGDEAPANPVKALQVVVSRLRSQTEPGIVQRTAQGYRLGLDPGEVDALALRALVSAAREAEATGDHVRAARLGCEALAVEVPDPGVPGVVEQLRAAARRLRTEAAAVAGRARAATGDHASALSLLEEADARDEATFAALLRSEAAVRGAPVALRRFEDHRTRLRETLGIDPGPRLQEVHAALLVADNPVREGLRHDASSLVGRDDDVRALRALVGAARVTSIVGPGGLGKTRLAHVLGREAEQPVVHFVELVGVVAPDDVVAAVGSALGVQDSVSGRRVLTPQQRNDVRGRIAQALDRVPTLLVLDNCEHVVEAVAGLVAFLVAAAPRLRVVTTTRAPLAIAAERVYPLGQLGGDAAATLFVERARSARPGVALPEDVVRRVVTRLDGLPLAIELAAAKVRVMSVDDIDRRLDDRFALLRGGDRSAPDRHQTLIAVIDWSWNLLTEPERRALRWLAAFHDGFTLAAAGRLLGHDALSEVGSLVDQSLVAVVDDGTAVRYRMLETVREFGRMQLVGAGEDTAAGGALLAWAREFVAGSADRLWTQQQVEAVRELRAEENNLADCLRAALTAPDPATTVRLLAALGTLWTVSGENPRVMALAGAVEDALRGWAPGPEDLDPAVAGAAMLAMNTMVGLLADVPVTLGLLERHGADASSSRMRGIVRVLLAQDPAEQEQVLGRLEVISREEDRDAAVLALMWIAQHRENAGDPEGAREAVARGLALTRPDDAPWLPAMLRTLYAGLLGQLGRHAEAAAQARAALPVLEQLDANDDAIQVRSMLAVGAITDGRLEEAERHLEEIRRRNDRRAAFIGPFVVAVTRAELALARGDVATGLALYRAGIAEMAQIRFPAMPGEHGLEPWTLFGESAAACACAVHGDGVDGLDLYDALRAKAPRVLAPTRGQLDYPVAGMVLHALGAWGLLHEEMPRELSARLLVLAERFACSRLTPTLDPAHTDAVAEQRQPGLLERLRAEYGARRGPDLLAEARAVVAGIPR